MTYRKETFGGCAIPCEQTIERTPAAEYLLSLRLRAYQTISLCSIAWRRLQDLPSESQHMIGEPAALHDLLICFDSRQAIAAALGYLRSIALRDPLLAEELHERLLELTAWLGSAIDDPGRTWPMVSQEVE